MLQSRVPTSVQERGAVEWAYVRNGKQVADVALAHFEYRQANVTEAQSKAVAGYCRKKGETPGCAFLSFFSDVCADLPLDNVRMNSNIVTKDSSWHCLQTILSAATSGKPKGLP